MKARDKVAATTTKKRGPVLKLGPHKPKKVKKAADIVESSENEEEMESDVLSGSDLNDEETGNDSVDEEIGNDSVEEEAESGNDSVDEEESENDSVEEEEESGNDSVEEVEESGNDSVEEEEESGNDSDEEDEAAGNGSVKHEETGNGSVEGDEENDGDSEEVKEEISGWADSMAKILHSSKPKHKKVLILSRAKKDYEINTAPQKKPKKTEDLEIDGMEHSEEAAAEEPEPEPKDSALCLKTQRKLELKQKRLEKQWDNLSRKKPQDGDVQVERALLKIATRGVVQLFNAVSYQQKTVKGKLRRVRNSEFKKDKVLSETKDMFQSALKKSSKIGDEDEIEIKEESDDDNSISKRSFKSGKDNKSSKKPTWQALQDDFMLDAKMKDWDRSSDED